ncbi:MAG: Rossmann-like and DUF2520 domain-containing protein [Planctomycetota bacterium]|jgi:predicted short-subunit dehydrogenase-like oxidoreductase (DUF2520 family)
MGATFAIIGAGTVGTALAKLLVEAGYQFVGAASRSLESAQAACDLAGAGRATVDPTDLTRLADLVLITTPDDAIQTVCDMLAEVDAFQVGTVVAHCSGALASDVLESARAAEACVGSFHPLQTLATVEEAVEILPGSYCCIEGDPVATAALESVANAIGLKVIQIPTEAKALYHAAAVMACNYLVALEDAALALAEAAGIERADALAALLPLVKGTVSNLEAVGTPDCLTGPIARGDVETVRGHVEAMQEMTPELLPLYRLLGLRTIDVALAKGTLTKKAAAELRRTLD